MINKVLSRLKLLAPPTLNQRSRRFSGCSLSSERRYDDRIWAARSSRFGEIPWDNHLCLKRISGCPFNAFTMYLWDLPLKSLNIGDEERLMMSSFFVLREFSHWRTWHLQYEGHTKRRVSWILGRRLLNVFLSLTEQFLKTPYLDRLDEWRSS